MSQPVSDPTSRLLAATRRRLIIVTLGLVALLVIGIGAATAFVALHALDADLDRALGATVDAAVTHLDGELPLTKETGEADETAPASSDTFVLFLDASGQIVANPSRKVLVGLPDRAAVTAAAASGSDLRTVDAGGVEVRLLTKPIVAAASAAPIGYVQGAFVLTLHDAQSNSLIQAVALVAVIGLCGAAVVTWLVTGDALIPIRRSFAAQRRFVADASHELKTPPSLIRANAEVLEREGLIAQQGRPMVADIVAETDRLSRLVGDLLQLASADATGLTFERRPVDLGTVVIDIVRQARALAIEHGLRLEAGPMPAMADPAVVSGDVDRLTQLILILVDNALDHAPAGTTVRIAIRTAQGRAILTVDDQGPGVPVPERERVFEPFTRLPGVRRDRATGSGLGLAIAKRIVVAHRGTIRIEDAPGGGASFLVSLPRTTRGDGPG